MKSFIKIRRLIALALVTVILVVALCSCSATEANVTVYFNVVKYDENNKVTSTQEIGHMPVTVKGNPPTALAAAESALIELDFENGYALTADGYSVGMVNGIAERSETDATTGYYAYWRCSINGNPTTTGRQSEVEIYEGDVLTFDFIQDSRPRQDNVYDSADESGN